MINFIEYIKQLWDTTSYVNPTRMNHMEDGIKGNSDAVVDLNEALDDVDTLIGDTSISGIGDGTVTGAISAVNVNLTQLLISLETATGTVTVGADSYLDIDVSPTIPSGYEVVSASIIQTSVPNTWLLPTLFRNSETRYTLYVRNLYSGGQLQGSYAVKFLLQKTSD